VLSPSLWWSKPALPLIQRYHWHSLPSTHTLSLTWAESPTEAPPGMHSILDTFGWVCLTSAKQECGVGQFERSFVSPEGGLYVSLLSLWPSTEYLPPIALATGLVVARLLGESCRLKWVNDVFIQDRKVAGVLIHRHASSVPQHNLCVISIGININSFPPFLSSQYGSVRQTSPQCCDIETLLHQVISALHLVYRNLIQQQGRLPSDFYDDIRQRAMHWQDSYDSLIHIGAPSVQPTVWS